LRLLPGAVCTAFDTVDSAMGKTPDVYIILEDTAVLGHCFPDVHVSLRGEKRNLFFFETVFTFRRRQSGKNYCLNVVGFFLS